MWSFEAFMYLHILQIRLREAILSGIPTQAINFITA
jgi:hypothetical protein